MAATASAFHVHIEQGDLVIDAEGGFAPKALPKHHDAPITTHGGGKLSTKSGEIPPILSSFVLEFDKHGHVDTTGLPFCTKGKLVATDVAGCPPGLQGRDRRHRLRQRGRRASRNSDRSKSARRSRSSTARSRAATSRSSLTPTSTIPGPTTFIVPIVIEKIHKGVYGYRINVKIPKIAGGYGHPISGSAKVGRKWTFKGKEHSFINARCETGHFQVRGEFTFKEVEEILHASFLLPCQVRK